MLVNELAKSAAKAVETSGTVQGDIRRVLSSNTEHEALEYICEAMSELKTWCEDHYIPNMDNGSADTQKRKQVNNVINDVSRIVRGATGLSIKCVQRSPSYVYEAVEYEARTPPYVESATVRPAPAETTENPVDVFADITKQIKAQPDLVMALMFREYPDPETLGNIFKEAKKMVDSLD